MEGSNCQRSEYPRWMNLKTAAWYATIGKNRLIKLAKNGEIKGYSDPNDGRNGWIFDRYTIDKYRNESDPKIQEEKKVLEILGSLK